MFYLRSPEFRRIDHIAAAAAALWPAEKMIIANRNCIQECACIRCTQYQMLFHKWNANKTVKCTMNAIQSLFCDYQKMIIANKWKIEQEKIEQHVVVFNYQACELKNPNFDRIKFVEYAFFFFQITACIMCHVRNYR